MANDVRPSAPPRTLAMEAAARSVAFWTFVVAGLALLAGVVLCEPYAAASEAGRRLRHARLVNAHQDRYNNRLQAEIEALKSDPFYLERLVRSDLAWQRLNERVVHLSGLRLSFNPGPPPPMPGPSGWLDRTADRLARHPRQRTFVLVCAVVLLGIGLACFADPRRRTGPAGAP